MKNALACFALWESLGRSSSEIASALDRFSGVKRRQEILGKPGGVTVIEDFAHHPTAVRETIRTVQEQFPGRTVFSIFEARSATSRRNVFQNEYADAFSRAQRVILPPVFNVSALPEDQRFSIDKFVSDVRARGVKIDVLDGVDAIVARVASEARPGDAVLVMSNGGFDGIYGKLMTALAAKK